MTRQYSSKLIAKKLEDFLENKVDLFISLPNIFSRYITHYLSLAFTEFLESEENVFNQYADLINLFSLAVDANRNCERVFLDQEKISYYRELMANECYWNINALFDQNEIQFINYFLDDRQKFFDWWNSKKQRRYRASLYISRSDIRQKVFKRDGKICSNCNSLKNITLDHIVPVSKGGEDCIENMQVLCKSCNSSKGNGDNGSTNKAKR